MPPSEPVAELKLELFAADGTPLTQENADWELALFLEESGVHDADDIDWEVGRWENEGGACVTFTGPATAVKNLAHWVSEETGELVLPKVLD